VASADLNIGVYSSLRRWVDFRGSSALNVRRPVDLAACVCAGEQGAGESQCRLVSDVDGELQLQVRFSSTVRLLAVGLRSAAGVSFPTEMRLYANAGSSVGFGSGIRPTATMRLVEPASHGSGCDYAIFPVMAARFGRVDSVVIVIGSGEGDASVGVRSVDLFGVAGNSRIDGAVSAVYEARAQVSDHAPNEKPVFFTQ
jgi:hypothetical protein